MFLFTNIDEPQPPRRVLQHVERRFDHGFFEPVDLGVGLYPPFGQPVFLPEEVCVVQDDESVYMVRILPQILQHFTRTVPRLRHSGLVIDAQAVHREPGIDDLPPYIAEFGIFVPAVAPGGREDDVDRIVRLFGQFNETFHPFDGFRVQRVLGDAFHRLIKRHGIDDAVDIHKDQVMHGASFPVSVLPVRVDDVLRDLRLFLAVVHGGFLDVAVRFLLGELEVLHE